MPAAALPRRSPADLLAAARSGLAEATTSPGSADRYARAHLAALRAASAVLATRARPTGARSRGVRGGSRSVWSLLAVVAPELAEWAAFFAAGAAKRAAAESGISRAATAREADDLLRDARTFLDLAGALVTADAVATPDGLFAPPTG